MRRKVGRCTDESKFFRDYDETKKGIYFCFGTSSHPRGCFADLSPDLVPVLVSLFCNQFIYSINSRGNTAERNILNGRLTRRIRWNIKSRAPFQGARRLSACRFGKRMFRIIARDYSRLAPRMMRDWL